MSLDKKIAEWLKKYSSENGNPCFIIGISGGIDSATVSTLCASTGIRTIVASMPIYQGRDELERASEHIKWLVEKFPNVTEISIDLSEVFESFKNTLGGSDHLALANLRSRIRMCSLYHLSSINGGIVVGTGNKIEDFGIGFFTKYGDGGVDISPIGDLTKTEVRELAKILGISEKIIKAKPTDGLWEDGRTDEDQIGASYEELEWAMDYIAKGEKEKISGRKLVVLAIYKRLNLKNIHKMSPIPVFSKQTRG